MDAKRPFETLEKLDERSLRTAFGRFSTGVAIVTACVQGRTVGMTVNSFSSVSLDPPLVLWSLRRSSTSFREFMEASHFAVNILSTAQLDLSQRFAKTSASKFEGIPYLAGLGGAPMFEGATAVFQCSTEAHQDGGDHVIVVGRVRRVSQTELRPLVFSEGRYAVTIDHPFYSSVQQLRPGGGAPDDPLHQFISVLLLRAFNRLVGSMESVRQRESITINESRILNIASAYPGRRLSELMQVIYLAESAVHDAIDSLRHKGLLEVTADGTLIVTAAGKTRSATLLAHIAEMERDILEDVPAEHLDILRNVLSVIIEARPRPSPAAAPTRAEG